MGFNLRGPEVYKASGQSLLRGPMVVTPSRGGSVHLNDLPPLGVASPTERHSPAPTVIGKGKAKMHKVMSEFKKGKLHSGSKKGPKVTSRKQAVAIGVHAARKGY